MGNRRASALLAAVLLMGAAGCGAVGDGAGGVAEADGANPQTPTSIDVALLECGDPDNEDPTLQLSEVALTEATWDMPEGFVETFRYSEDLPVEHIESFWAAEPEQDPVALNVLTVVVYSRLDWGSDIDQCGRVSITAIDERLTSYREGNGAEPLTDITSLEIAGLPALEQDLRLPEYSYRGYWVFSRNELVHLYCQWTSDEQKDAVLSGCDELVGSLEIPGA